MTPEELKKILDDHKKWLKDNRDGQRADLRSADLSEANLRWANLREADLREAKSIKSCSVCWSDHGERGRALLAVEINEEVRYFCGCFSGTQKELESYIQNGEERLKRSRTLAFEFCRDRMAEMMEGKR